MGLGFNSRKVATQGVDSGLGGGYNTVWDDVTTSLIGKRLYSTSGKVDYAYSEASVKFQQGGDLSNASNYIIMTVQYPHKAVIGEGAVITPHIHFTQPDDEKHVFELAYRIQNNGEAKVTSWTTLTANTDDDCVYTYPGSGDFNNILKFGTDVGAGITGIDASTLTISSTLQFKLTRTDSVGASNIYVQFFDYHAKFDTMGSYGEYIKRSSD